MERIKYISASHRNSRGSLSTLQDRLVCCLLKEGVRQKRHQKDVDPPPLPTHDTWPAPCKLGSRLPFPWQSPVTAQSHWRGNGLDMKSSHNPSLRGWMSQEAQVSAGPHHPRGRHLLCNCSYVLCTFPGYTEAAYIIFITNGLASWKSPGLFGRGMLRVSQVKVELGLVMYVTLVLVWAPRGQDFVLFAALFILPGTQLSMWGTRGTK